MTMTDTVAKFGLTQINPQGEAFNPEFHQAMAIQESTEFAFKHSHDGNAERLTS